MRTNNLRQVLSLVGLIVVAAWAAWAKNTSPAAQPDAPSHTLQATNADAAWTELQNANHLPLPYAEALADEAKDFYTRFPNDNHATGAKVMEFQIIQDMLQWGATNQQPRLITAGTSLLNDPAITGENHMVLLWILAQNSPLDKARPLLQEITNNPTPSKLREEAVRILKNMEFVGTQITLQFTAVDGRNVDLAKLKGKVVLLDFWATWCPPCLEEVPNVKKNYDQFHAKGFEIIGISLDKDKDQLTRFTAEHKMEWPQFFDGLYWQNKYARQFGIESTPTMWLIDKKGILRDVEAGKDLSGKVQKLLVE